MQTQKKLRLPKPPQNRFSFSIKPKAAKPSGAKTVLFVFEEDLKAKALKKLTASFAGKAQASRKAILREKRRKAFLAKSGQRLYLSEADVLLIGLGKARNFHPEGFAAACRSLGEGLSKEEEGKMAFCFSESLHEALESYKKIHKNYFSESASKRLAEALRLFLQKGKTKEKKGTAKPGLLSPLDYAASFRIEDILFALACNLEIGAADLRLLSQETQKATKKGKKVKKEKIQKKQNKKTRAEILVPGKKDAFSSCLQEASIVSEMLNRSRYLASLPGNYLNPEGYESYVREFFSQLPVKLQVFGEKRLSKLGCGGILSVGQGSAIPPRMLVLEYKPKKSKNKRPFVLVGKGVTFDSGGISLKPSAEMHEMKFDMCGSALALHSLALAARRGLPLHIVALIGLAENLPDGSAIKPGDVYTAYNGKTVEIQNTDAEGRLILADLLSYASDKYKPGILFEYSTLTGACIIALGHHVAGIMTPSDGLYDSIEKASRLSLDRVWRLPHWSIYGEALKSDIADLRNIGGRPAGTISAMRFLQSFVGEEIPWAHFDIAGAAWSGKAQGSQPSGATGWGIRLMNQYFTNLM